MTVKERLKDFIVYKQMSVRSFEKLVGLSLGYVNNIRVSIQPDKVKMISDNFPELNTGWLLTGEGSMLKEDEKKENVVSNAHQEIGDTVTVSREAWEMIKIQNLTIQSQQRTIEHLTKQGSKINTADAV